MYKQLNEGTKSRYEDLWRMFLNVGFTSISDLQLLTQLTGVYYASSLSRNVKIVKTALQ